MQAFRYSSTNFHLLMPQGFFFFFCLQPLYDNVSFSTLVLLISSSSSTALTLLEIKLLTYLLMQSLTADGSNSGTGSRQDNIMTCAAALKCYDLVLHTHIL